MRFSLRRLVMSLLITATTILFISDFRKTLQTLSAKESPMTSSRLNWAHAPNLNREGAGVADNLRGSFLRGLLQAVIGSWTGQTAYHPPHVWPSGFTETDDRILAQLNYIPESFNQNTSQLKVIYVITGMSDARRGQYRFLDDHCPVNRCYLTDVKQYAPTAHAVLFQNGLVEPDFHKPSHQIWIYFQLESPHHSVPLIHFNKAMNWTATYRSDSTIVTPYEKYVPFPNASVIPSRPLRNYAVTKSKQVAWFVSNCHTKNNRFEYAKELSNYISVDIYGQCGSLYCPREQKANCYAMLSKDYKFYLAFENSNCKNYITEKFYWNALSNNIIPVVMGARREEYELVAPPKSFIHVDDFSSPRELAAYLRELDENDDLYNEYFAWKGTGEFINTKFYCRLCAMLHDDSHVQWYKRLTNWWSGPDICVEATPNNKYASWRRVTSQSKPSHAGVTTKSDVGREDIPHTRHKDDIKEYIYDG